MTLNKLPSLAGKVCSFCCGSPWRVLGSLVVVFIVEIVAVAALGPIVQALVSGAQIELTKATLSDATSNSYRLEATLKLSNVGPIAATIEPFDARLASRGVTFSLPLHFDTIYVGWGGTATIHVNQTLVLTPGVNSTNSTPTVHEEAAAVLSKDFHDLLMGNDATWIVHATDHIQVQAMGFLGTKANLGAKNLTIAAIGPLTTKAAHLELNNGNETTGELKMGVHVGIDCSSIIEIHDLGDLLFDYYFTEQLGNVTRVPSHHVGQIKLRNFSLKNGTGAQPGSEVLWAVGRLAM